MSGEVKRELAREDSIGVSRGRDEAVVPTVIELGVWRLSMVRRDWRTIPSGRAL